MQKFKKFDPKNVSTVNEMLFKNFPEYKGYSGNEQGYVFNFGENTSELAVDTFLNGISDFALEAQKLKAEKVAVLYDAMVKDIYDEMEKVFGTRNDVSAAATSSTYEAMLKRPNKYKNALGLSNASEVEAYANTKLDAVDAYAIFRIGRISKFTADKTAVMNAQ